MNQAATLEQTFGPLSDRERRIAAQAQGGAFQERVLSWMWATFGQEVAADRQERNHRFLEEALELVQAGGATREEVQLLVDYVYGRPVGEVAQEVGGVMITLAALCLAHKLDLHQCADIELARVWTLVDKIRAKHASKPKGSPLPGVGASQNLETHQKHCTSTSPYSPVLSCCGGGSYDAKPGFRVHIQKMVESCGTTYVICLDRPERPLDAKPWDEGRISPDRFENLEHANSEATEWADFLGASFTPYEDATA